MKKPLYILGINEAQCASAALLKDGQIIAATAEERFSRIKNQWGFPKKAIEFCCRFAGIETKELDLLVLGYKDPFPHFTELAAHEKPNATPHILKSLRNIAPTLETFIPLSVPFTDFGRQLYYQIIEPKNTQLQIDEIAKTLSLEPTKIKHLDHHLCHAAMAYFSNPNFTSSPILILTCDGAGDQVSAQVAIGKKGTITPIARTPHASSLGLLYSAATLLLGLKPHEDEYKVMGLAPYAPVSQNSPIYKIFSNLLWVENLTFHSKVHSRHFGSYLQENLRGFRFDTIAGAIQTFFEETILTWTTNAIRSTGIHEIALSGGSFLNVKANTRLARHPKIKKIYCAPSPGDDSNAIGAAYFGYHLLRKDKPLKPISSLYLGPAFAEKNIGVLFKESKYKIQKPKDVNKSVALLLAKGMIVARFVGRMEFGARALGNRSLLSDPRNIKSKEQLNQLIKHRDFWMPFAPTVLESEKNKLLVVSKKIQSPFMMYAFETTGVGKESLAAAVHPYDKTARAQILTYNMNPLYFTLITEFKKITGIGALLNTSLNIHGEPVINSPEDAYNLLEKTDLRYFQFEEYLITKV